MHSLIVVAAAGLASLAQAYTAPGAQTWGPLLTPDNSDPVTQGQTALVTWDPESHPTDGVTVSLVLCHGPSTNCVDAPTAIASGIPAAQKSYSWNVPCDLAAGTQNTDTGYGMLIIVDGTGEFQFSTQFSVLANSSCSGDSSSSSSSSASSSSSSSSASVVTSSTSTTTSSVSSTPSGSSWGSSTSRNHLQSSSSVSSSGSASATTTTSAASGSSATSSSPAASSTVVISGTSTYTVVASGTTTFASASPVSATSSAPQSTFTGGAAPQVGLSGAGLVVAGAFAVLAM